METNQQYGTKSTSRANYPAVLPHYVVTRGLKVKECEVFTREDGSVYAVIFMGNASEIHYVHKDDIFLIKEEAMRECIKRAETAVEEMRNKFKTENRHFPASQESIFIKPKSILIEPEK